MNRRTWTGQGLFIQKVDISRRYLVGAGRCGRRRSSLLLTAQRLRLPLIFSTGHHRCQRGTCHSRRPTSDKSRVSSTPLMQAQQQQDENPWKSLTELFGAHSGDPGHWNFSPEWWGSQGGGWGRDDGQVIYREESAYNGTVEVTAHEGTAIHCSERQVEWRVLRFNGVTRQSASRVVSSSQQDNSWAVDPACLAQEYLKSMASVYAALRPSSHHQQEGRWGRGERLLCLGVGGGSLPQFLAHHFPDSEVDAVEIDPVVMHAAHQAMGLGEDHSSGSLRFHVQDAFQFAKGCAESGTPEYDAIFMDVFDGEDNTPRTLLEQEFASYLNDILHPRHGSLIMNVHGIPPSRPAEVFRAAMMARDAATSTSMIFSVGCKKQRMNITLVCTRGHGLPADSKATPAALKSRAAHVASAAGFAFPAGTRACYNYSRLA